MRIDPHTHVVPPRWEDFAARYGGGRWPRLVPRDACRATLMTGSERFRELTRQAWDPAARRIEGMDRLGIDRQVLSPPPVGTLEAAGLDPAARAAVEGGNAARLLSL